MPTREFRHLTRVEDTMRLFLDAVGIVRGVELVKIHDALGRVLARRVVAAKYLPAQDIAVVDGYAVRSVDLRHASSRKPVVLQLVGESKLGELCGIRVRKGGTVAVATGSTIPKGSDAVVMVENAGTLSGSRVEFRESVSPGQGMTGKGDDLRPGRLVLERGSRLRPEDLGVLKAVGLKAIPVVRRVRVGVLSTGNELVNAVRKRRSAKIVDLNRPILTAMLRELGAVPVDLGIVEDDEEAITVALKAGLATADLVLVTAGASAIRGMPGTA